MDCKLKQARASSNKTQLVVRINDDDNYAGVGKRKILIGETLPVPKKQNVVGLLACKGGKSQEMSLVYPGDGLRGEDFGKCSGGFEKSSDFGVNVKLDKVTSVRIVDKAPLDFRCTICQELPRLLNRSELYRHYAFRHFYSNLMKEFGHLKTCPVCNVDLKTNSIASHFGQKHSHVEHFLPVEAWIPISKVGANISRGCIGRRCVKGSKEKAARKGRKIRKVKKVKRKKNSLKGVPLVWLEIPQGFNPDGNERRVKSSFNISKQPFRIATVNGFDIELEIDEQENLVQSSDMCFPLLSAHEQVMQCRICKRGFSTKQLVVLHVQTTHHMKGSGDESLDYEAMLRSGHIATEKSMNNGDVPALSIEGITSLDNGEVVKSQSLELTTEDLEPDITVEDEVFHNLADGSAEKGDDKTGEDWEIVCDAFNTKLEASGVKSKHIEGKEAVDKSDKEWQVACAAFESMIADICDSSDVLGMKIAKEWGEVLAVESIKDLQVETPGRDSWCSAISGYISKHRSDSS